MMMPLFSSIQFDLTVDCSVANKRIIADITEMAILAFDQRDESQSKITAFQERNDKDAAAYTAELKVNTKY